MSARLKFLTCHAKNPNGCISASARLATRLACAPALRFTPFPWGAAEIDALVALGWLPGRAVFDRDSVGEAVASTFREMVHAKIL